jgi:hypothetical protein
MFTELEISSAAVRGKRKVWLQRLSSEPSRRCVLFLDAEIYINAVNAPQIMREQFESGVLPNMTCAYLSFGVWAC